MTQYIAILGPRQSGKSTIAKLIKLVVMQKGYTSAIYPFATPIYRMASVFTGLPAEQMESNSFKTTDFLSEGITGRTILNNIAKGLQSLEPDCMTAWWVKHAPEELDYIIVPDVRTEVELWLMKSYASALIHIHRPGVHYTEEDFDTCLGIEPDHYIFNNSGTKKELMANVQALVDLITVEQDNILEYALSEGAGHD